MSGTPFIRHINTPLARRRSLRLLGGAGLVGAMAGPAAARKGKKGKTRCRQLGEQCRRGFAEICRSQPDPEACQAFAAPCCEGFARCRVSAGVVCTILRD